MAISNRVELWIKQLENDANALDQAYSHNATALDIKTVEFDYSTKIYGSQSYGQRINVTFNTIDGSNTPACLGISSNGSNKITSVTRKPYSGGAKWTVTVFSVNDTDISFHFKVNSLISGKIAIS